MVGASVGGGLIGRSGDKLGVRSAGRILERFSEILDAIEASGTEAVADGFCRKVATHTATSVTTSIVRTSLFATMPPLTLRTGSL